MNLVRSDMDPACILRVGSGFGFLLKAGSGPGFFFSFNRSDMGLVHLPSDPPHCFDKSTIFWRPDPKPDQVFS